MTYEVLWLPYKAGHVLLTKLTKVLLKYRHKYLNYHPYFTFTVITPWFIFVRAVFELLL